MRALAVHRLLTRDLVAALLAPQSDISSHTNLDRRLEKLTKEGYLVRMRQRIDDRDQQRSPYAYACARPAVDVLRKRQMLPFPGDWKENNRIISGIFLNHTLLVARFATALTVALRALPSVALEHYERESRPRGGYQLKRDWDERDGRRVIAPDAFFKLGGVHPEAHFLEADRSTKPHKRLFEQLAAYAEMYAQRRQEEYFGVATFRVCIVTESKERASNVLNLLLALTDEQPEAARLFLVTTESSYADEPRNVLAAVWRSPENPDQLRALVPSPLPRR
jgi:hypothetical protein